MTLIGSLLWRLGIKTEEACVLIEDYYLDGHVVTKRAIYKKGTVNQVSVDWEIILNQDRLFNHIIGFWHTHAPWVGTIPSVTDEKTMDSWVKALGKDLYCLIECNNKIGGWLFRKNGGFNWIQVHRTEDGGFICSTRE